VLDAEKFNKALASAYGAAVTSGEDEYIDDYFGSRYRLNDFMLTGMLIYTDSDVRSRENARLY
jgi:hypothetical protein